MASPESPNSIVAGGRGPKFYRTLGYCIAVVALAVTAIVLLTVERSNKPCFPRRGISQDASSRNTSLRIVGGARAGYKEYPYVVSLQLERRHFCGGSLISQRHVLTAAHCLNPVKDLFITAVVGTTDLRNYLATRHAVGRKAIHPNYDGHVNCDCGVAKLEHDVELSDRVSIVKLPESGKSYLYHGLELSAAGFGKTSTTAERGSDYLKKLTTYVCTRPICESYFGNVRLHGHFCAVLAAEHGLCFGDSGGPVTLNKTIVIGIVTGVTLFGCGVGVPDVLTYVPDFLDFIKAQMKK